MTVNTAIPVPGTLEDGVPGSLVGKDPRNLAVAFKNERSCSVPETPAAPASALTRIRDWVTRDTSAGILLIVAAALALIWANSPLRSIYHSLTEFTIGPESLHLNLSLAAWAADGLLAIFFFTVGLELKQEFVTGSLRSPAQAALPMLAAVGGMVVPAVLFFLAVTNLGQPAAAGGWAIPTATDIAFAVGVLALFGRGLPSGLRLFLLTLAVVDDLLAIIVIALFYTAEIHAMWLAVAALAIIAFALVVRSRRPQWWLMIPFAVIAWASMHASGIHATIAGVLLGFMVPALRVHGEHHARTHHYNAILNPFANGLILPIFAFFSAGVTLVEGGGPGAVLGQPVVIGVAAGLVIGKFIGVLGTTWIFTAFTPLALPSGLAMQHMIPVGFLTGIGFTVSLLIAELSFPAGTPLADGARIAVLLGTLAAAVLAGISLRIMAQAMHAKAPAEGTPEINRVTDDPDNED
ncbi:Na+/H+ antiporter NhaA [Dermatophilus congolensis]|uniref:Na+/H+ antiporter NhaA n=1 Tax=Dermatophilus congolensis TaxID=1863 RepID=UPI00312C9526